VVGNAALFIQTAAKDARLLGRLAAAQLVPKLVHVAHKLVPPTPTPA
jgi:hypothetical protein